MERELLFLHLILLNIVSLTVSHASLPILHLYISGSGNYSTNSSYQKNLVALLSNLSSGTDRYGFYNSSFGDNPDKVYAIVLCRGDVELHACRSCINDSTIKLPQLLPNNKGAIGWYDYCMLRYSNDSINGIVATDPRNLMVNGRDALSMNDFKQAVSRLLDNLRSQAASGGAHCKFVTGNTSGTRTIVSLRRFQLLHHQPHQGSIWSIKIFRDYSVSKLQVSETARLDLICSFVSSD
ncbi:cysteine-rich receptor-like protein kinase 29 [Rhododendron vialii]|uniref:cysteine-rich receptor-like protein kinase 29 n=1 Tax=Rhododendron vialii TaxID=182163 RepID=UPI00265E931F|nr:cysteine-rich receptor-like protein kinase 29 [Rhododendron vialii]